MTQTYEVVLDGQLGERFGTLTWTEAGNAITGSLFLLGFSNPVCGKRDGQTLELAHKLQTAVSTLICKTHAELYGDELSGIVVSDSARMKLRGKKQEAVENEVPG